MKSDGVLKNGQRMARAPLVFDEVSLRNNHCI
jgi:hypothetical protein